MGRKKKKQMKPWCWYPFHFLIKKKKKIVDRLKGFTFYRRLKIHKEHKKEKSLFKGVMWVVKVISQ